MANLFQIALIPKQIKVYVFAITLSIKKKNFSSMSKEIGISLNRFYGVYRDLKRNIDHTKATLIKIATSSRKESLPSVLIIDATQIKKWFAQSIENLAFDYDGVIQKSKKCLSPVVAAWSNLKITVPLDFMFWTNRQFTKNYKKKTELAQELIHGLKSLIPIDYVILDGAFASFKMIDFFNKNNINYCMRIPRNRVIISQDGTKEQLQKHPALKLKRNQRYKTIVAIYKGIECFFTAHKRYSKKKKALDVVYIVSSLNISPKEQAKAYNIRWNIEKMFRTTKQSLGLADCQSTNIEKQRLHIFSVFLSYALLEEQKLYYKKKSVEEVLRSIRIQKTLPPRFESYLWEQTIMN